MPEYHHIQLGLLYSRLSTSPTTKIIKQYSKSLHATIILPILSFETRISEELNGDKNGLY
jgi:hypothetical protein